MSKYEEQVCVALLLDLRCLVSKMTHNEQQ